MEQHRKILLATDLSARSDRAMDRASMLARRHGAELFVVHVLEPTPEMLDAQTVRFSPLAARDRLIEIVRRDLSSDLGDAGGRVTMRIEEGNPAEVILGIANEQSCDVIVTGVARNETLGRFTLGKTVNRLLRASDIPLLIVTDRARKPYQKIVVATDFSEVSQHARTRRRVRSTTRSAAAVCATGALGGIGFTMSLFIAGVALPNEADYAAAKIAIFLASLIAVGVGVLILWRMAETSDDPAAVSPSAEDRTTLAGG
jgi:nucleotide-binding universal stress UspA family protein